MRLSPLLPLVFLVACSQVDNSGGPPPSGDSVSFVDLDLPTDFFCESMADDAVMVAVEADMDALFEACFPLAVIAGEARQPWLDLLAATDAEDALVFAVGSAGGCIGDAWIEDIKLDGSTLRPWMLKEDSSYGRNQVACTADWGISQHLVRVEGAAAADSIELTLGVFNPELPGAPDRPAIL